MRGRIGAVVAALVAGSLTACAVAPAFRTAGEFEISYPPPAPPPPPAAN